MSRICLLFCCVLLWNVGTSQQFKSKIPPFKIRLISGAGYTYKQLEKNKELILIYLSPDCEHCKEFTKAFLSKRKKWENKQVVMISYKHITEVKKFSDILELSKYANIKVGSEGYTFLVQQYYQINQFPFIALFNRKGGLYKTISNSLGPIEMVNAI